jgi:hypothetical protein
VSGDPGAAPGTRAAGQSEVRRAYGSGSLYKRAGNWYGRWHADGRRVKRKLGPVRRPGTRGGMTRAQAERELRRLMTAAEALQSLPDASLSRKQASA